MIFVLIELLLRFMKKNFKYALFGFAALFYFSCASQPVVETGLPESLKKNGMVSSSTYQANIITGASSCNEAIPKADPILREKTYNLLTLEPFIPRFLTDIGKKQLRDLIKENGKIIRCGKQSNSEYYVVFHVTKPGLRTYLQQIR